VLRVVLNVMLRVVINVMLRMVLFCKKVLAPGGGDLVLRVVINVVPS